MLVPAGLHDVVVGLARQAAREYTVGDPAEEGTRLGPVVSEAQRARVTGYIERGIADGATLVTGRPERIEGLANGAYVQPTIFANVNPDSVIARARRSSVRSS